MNHAHEAVASLRRRAEAQNTAPFPLSVDTLAMVLIEARVDLSDAALAAVVRAVVAETAILQGRATRPPASASREACEAAAAPLDVEDRIASTPIPEP